MKWIFFLITSWMLYLSYSCKNKSDTVSNIIYHAESKEIIGDTISIVDIKTGKLVLYEYYSDVIHSNFLTIKQIDEAFNTVDSVTYTNLLMAPDIKPIGDNFIQCKISFRAGMGVYFEKTILLSSVNNKTTVSLDIITHNEVNIGDEFEQYLATISYQDSVIYLTEKNTLKKNKKSKIKNFTLNLNNEKGVFFNNMIGNEEKENISITLYFYSYLFQNNNWLPSSLEHSDTRIHEK